MSQQLPLVYVIGDSISLQYGPYLQEFLSGYWRYERKSGEAEALLNLDRPQGANGGDSSMVTDFLRSLTATDGFHPDLLLVNCGLHDIKIDPATRAIQIELPRYEENLKEIVRLAADRRIPLAWIRTTHVSDEIHNADPKAPFHRYARDHAVYDEAACRIMADGGVPLIDLCGFTRNLGVDRELFCDHVHFVESVREKQAAFLTGWPLAWRGASS